MGGGGFLVYIHVSLQRRDICGKASGGHLCWRRGGRRVDMQSHLAQGFLVQSTDRGRQSGGSESDTGKNHVLGIRHVGKQDWLLICEKILVFSLLFHMPTDNCTIQLHHRRYAYFHQFVLLFFFFHYSLKELVVGRKNAQQHIYINIGLQ